MGSLGFLTNHNFKSMNHDLKEVIYGSESLEQCSIDGSVGACMARVTCTHATLLANVSVVASCRHIMLSHHICMQLLVDNCCGQC